MRGANVQVKQLEKALCIVLLGLGLTQGSSSAQQIISKEAGTETVFAYRSFSNRGLGGYLFPNGQWSIPNYVPVELLPLDPSAWASATIGSTVTFLVVRGASAADVVNGGLIDAKVTRIRAGKLRLRRGRLEPRVLEVAVDGGVKLALESTARSRIDSTLKHAATFPLRGVGVALEVPEYLFLGIVCSVSFCEI
jgi:hypothetical protein